MPFDGADVSFRSLPKRSPSSIRFAGLWNRRFRTRFEFKRPEAKWGAPNSEALAALPLLEEARRLIEARERWTCGVYETVGGKYCAVGALRAASRCLRDAVAERAAHKLLLVVAQGRGFRQIESMNDYSTHEQVLTAFDEAIAAAARRRALNPA